MGGVVGREWTERKEREGKRKITAYRHLVFPTSSPDQI
jgi:hypothetical protein